MTGSSRAMPTGYLSLRRATAGRDAPWPGTIVRDAGGNVRFLGDAALFAADWAGWTAGPSGHVLGPIDVVRRQDGHDLVLPACAEPVVQFLDRRRGARAPLTEGEQVTLGASLLRGSAELTHAARTLPGRWWLTLDGRPVLAAGDGEAPAAEQTLALARSVDSPLSAWPMLIDALQAERISMHDVDAVESALFAAADGAPLVLSTLAPRSASGAGAAVGSPLGAALGGTDAESDEHRGGLLRHVDADLADMVSRATTGLWRRATRRQPPRARPWLVAAGIAAGLLAAGLAWPSSDSGAADADPGEPRVAAGAQTTAAAAPQQSAPDADPPATSPAAASDQPLDAAMQLLDARVACRAEPSCLERIQEDPYAVMTSGVIDAPPGERTVSLLDDLGDVAVLRVDPVEEGPAGQLVVISRSDGAWLLRDVHDVAQQP